MRRIKINKINFLSESFYILAETAFSHEGSMDYIKKQISSAAEGEANGVKFQVLINKDDSYSPNYKVYDLFDKWMFTREQWTEILNYTKNETELEIVVLPIDNKALNFCIENKEKIDAFEIHSINFNQKTFLNELSKINKPIILGIGGRTLDDINYCLSFFDSALNKQNIIMMYGFQSFPTNYEELNLGRIKKYKRLYQCNMGYADHTSYDDDFDVNLIEYAYLNGARVFEKHLVLNKGEERVDYEAAVEKNDLLLIRDRLNKLMKISGKGNNLDFTESEIIYRNREKQIVSICDINKGERFTEENIGFKVHENSSDLQQKEYNSILGKKAIEDIPKNTPLKFSQIGE